MKRCQQLINGFDEKLRKEKMLSFGWVIQRKNISMK